MATQNKNNKGKRKFINFKKYNNMSYMDIIEEYTSYPSDTEKTKFSYVTQVAENYSESNAHLAKTSYQYRDEIKQSRFLSEEDKADGWIQKFPRTKKYSQFLITNLHYLPEHLWEKMKPFYQDNIHVGYKVSDGAMNFFVNCADTDESTRLLMKEISKNSKDLELIKRLILLLEEKGINSWITIRARKCLNIRE